MADNIKDTKKYKVTRESKIGRIVNLTNLTSGMVIAVAISIGATLVKEVKNYMDLQEYSYDSSYDSYSEQIEDMLQIDLSSSLEDDLNSLQMMRETIETYQSSDSLISKSDSLKILENQKTNFETSALNIAKKWCANEWGGAASDYNIIPEGSSMPGWVATHKDMGPHQLPNGNISDFLTSIGKVQSYSREMIEQTSDSDEFVDSCDTMCKYSGIVATSIAESKSNSK